ncbi:hypothetical protein IFR05_017338 [Cadophora sp. M221]|nr:hypothetical protein IFR05_017338 [Cadophora sp. M221]
MAPRIIPGKFVLVGMTSSRTYKLLNVETFQELISADVKFDEYNTYNIDRLTEQLRQNQCQSIQLPQRLITLQTFTL